jgi:hypothetical protein
VNATADLPEADLIDRIPTARRAVWPLRSIITTLVASLILSFILTPWPRI